MDRFLEESWNRTTEFEKELTPEEKASSVMLTIEEKFLKLKTKKTENILPVF